MAVLTAQTRTTGEPLRPPPIDAARRGPLPIVLGVTGHRDLRDEDVSALKASVRTLFDDLIRNRRHTPLMLLSPLASGADQLVAEVALEPRYGIPVVAPLPLELSEYERDFAGEQRDRFRRLLAQTRCSFFVGYNPGSDGVCASDAHNVRDENGPHRARQYAQVGAYVARNSQILIALWDGVESRSVGGTSQIVDFKRSGVASGFGPAPGPLDRPESGPVWHIVTPRTSCDVAAGLEPYSLIPCWPDGAAATDAQDADDSVRGLRRGRRTAAPSYRDVFERMLGHVDDFNGESLDSGTPDSAELSTAAIRRAADLLATKNQTRTVLTMGWLYGMAAVASAFFILYSHVYHKTVALLAVSLVVSGAALILYEAARRSNWQNRHQDYRGLAEGLRVQEQWHAANVRETVADHYLRQHRGELEWIRSAIRACRVLDEAAAPDEDRPLADLRERLWCVYRDWIGDEKTGQIGYYRDRAACNQRLGDRQSTWASYCWIVTLCSIFVAVLVFGFVSPDSPSGTERWYWGCVVAAIAGVAILSGLLGSYAQKRAYVIHAKRYRRMQSFFAQAGAKLEALLRKEPFTYSDYRAAQDVIRDLGREALLENAAWMMLHRERPLEYVPPG